MQQNQDSTPLSFMKMHGLGNDFVVIDSRGGAKITTAALAIALGDRNRGVGFDQLAEIRDSEQADIELDFWNADGTMAQACGNATRCVAHHVMTNSGTQEITIKTARGILSAILNPSGHVSVNMGRPQFDWAEIPIAHQVDTANLPIDGAPMGIGMGNPHCVFVVEDADAIDLTTVGPKIEKHALFPERTNVEFISRSEDGTIRMRVWERGTGVTLACGSGACAAAVAAHLKGLSDKHVEMELDGGRLSLDWREDGVWMTGPTEHVFTASLTPRFLAGI